MAAAVGTEDRAAVMDSMILCKFLRGVFDDPFAEWAALLAAVTGWDVDADELRATARRIVLAKRVFNQREGATAGGRHAAGAAAGDPAGAGFGPGRHADRASGCGHGRRLLRGPRAGRRTAAADPDGHGSTCLLDR